MSFREVLGLVATLVVIVGAVYGVGKFIDSRIDRRIKDEQFLRKIALYLRPTAIFDETGAVLVDQGAMEFIDELEVVTGDNAGLPQSILVVAKRHLAHTPILTTLGNEFFEATVSREGKFGFRYQLDYTMWQDDVERRRFRLEIIP